MANPKKPNHLKVISGTNRKDREAESVIEHPLVENVPVAPDWLSNIHAKKEWDRLSPILHANKLLTQAGLMAFGHMCSLHGKLVQLWAAGESPSGHLLSQYRNLINDFGLTPVAQGKIKPMGGDKPGNKFSKNGKKID